MLIEEVETSLISEQGIAMWTAVTALWRYRCEVHHRRQNPTQGGYMLLWVGDLIAWQRQGSTPYRQGTLTSLICTVQQWIAGYRALRGVEDQGLPQKKSKKERQQDRKELLKEEVLNKYQLD